jgi:hypothetical protein
VRARNALLERLEVQIVDVRHSWVGCNDVRKLLKVTQAVGETSRELGS